MAWSFLLVASPADDPGAGAPWVEEAMAAFLGEVAGDAPRAQRGTLHLIQDMFLKAPSADLSLGLSLWFLKELPA